MLSFNPKYTLKIDKFATKFAGHSNFAESKNKITSSAENTDVITINNDLTTHYTITKQQNASLGTATFTISNLSFQTQEAIRQDILDPANISGTRYVEFSIESETSSILLFRGKLQQAFPNHIGGTPGDKMILECIDGKFGQYNATINRIIKKGTPKETAIKSIAKEFEKYNMKVGKIDVSSKNKNDIFERDTLLCGDLHKILYDLFPNHSLFIHNETVNILHNNGGSFIREHSFDDGTFTILGTPKRQMTTLNIETTLTPASIGDEITLNMQSRSSHQFNGTYKVIGTHHIGTLGGSVKNEHRTILTLLAPKPFLQRAGGF